MGTHPIFESDFDCLTEMCDHDQLQTDREVQNFKATLRVLLSDERLLQSGKEAETQVIDKCSVALNHLVELHYDKRHLLDVIRRQQEEIDWTRNKIRDSGTLIQHLESVKGTHEDRIKEQTDNRDTTRVKNVKREDNIKGKTQQLINNHNNKMQETVACKNMEIGNLRQQNGDLGKENEKLKEEFKAATNSTAGLKTALEQARDKLSDALVEGNVTVE